MVFDLINMNQLSLENKYISNLLCLLSHSCLHSCRVTGTWRMWWIWRNLISNNLYNLQWIVIYSVEWVWEFLHLVQTVMWQLQCNSNSVFRATHKPRFNSRTNQAQCSVSVRPATGTWRLMYIFINVLYQQFTADCWHLFCCNGEGYQDRHCAGFVQV